MATNTNWEIVNQLQQNAAHIDCKEHFQLGENAKVVQSLKAWTSKDLREKFAIIRQTRYSDDFWASSYYCGTAGHVSAEVVAKYIRENSNKF